MLVSVFSPKGGSGTSVCSALIAKAFSGFGPTMLIDACKGDLDLILDPDIAPSFSFSDWCESSEPTPRSLMKISTTVLGNLQFVTGAAIKQKDENELATHLTKPVLSEKREDEIVESIMRVDGNCVIDCSRGETSLQSKILSASDLAIMVMRQCYLALNRATEHPLIKEVDACVVIQEDGRSISADQIAEVLNLKILIEVNARRDFAKTIDAGVLIYRTPEKLISPFRDFVIDTLDQVQLSSDDFFDEFAALSNKQFWDESSEFIESRSVSQFPTSQYSRHAKSALKAQRNL